MKSDFYCYLDGFNLITIILPNKFLNGNKSFSLKALNYNIPLTIVKIEALGNETKYSCEINETISLNETYNVIDEDNNISLLRIGKVVRTEMFDLMYEYDKHDLGVTYTKEKTVFKLWSPVAKEIELELINSNNMKQIVDLKYSGKGLWEAILHENLEGAKYRYHVRVNELFKTITDPYAISSTANGKYNYVVDKNKFRKFKHKKPDFSGKNVDAIIYEAMIRDLTMSGTSKALNKGKFKGLLEKHENEGIEYIKTLGVTHLQLLPIFDFEGVDELNQTKLYNWGYNPSQYNVVEGSYSIDPEDPYLRINELIELIDYLHESGLRVSMDVVFNHVYNINTFPFNDLVPGYFYRYDNNGMKTSSSGCGNDLASEKIMVNHFIIQSIKYWLETFQISAFRFDLMGLNDIELITKVEIITKRYDEACFIYGEGWNMESILPPKQRANMSNAKLLPNVAFFNDTFRDKIKGGTFSKELGYSLGGNLNKTDLYYLFTGSSLDNFKFYSPSQSINYVECHDNHTFYDRAKILNKNLTATEIIDYARLALSFTILSQGIPFIHLGQEFLRSKNGVENSYKSSDLINAVNWDLKEQNSSLIETVKTLIKIRKEYRVFRLTSNAEIKKHIKSGSNRIEFKTVEFLLTDLTKEFVVYFKNDYEDELLAPKEDYNLYFDGISLVNSKASGIVANRPGCYIFIKERFR